MHTDDVLMREVWFSYFVFCEKDSRGGMTGSVTSGKVRKADFYHERTQKAQKGERTKRKTGGAEDRTCGKDVS